MGFLSHGGRLIFGLSHLVFVYTSTHTAVAIVTSCIGVGYSARKVGFHCRLKEKEKKTTTNTKKLYTWYHRPSGVSF